MQHHLQDWDVSCRLVLTGSKAAVLTESGAAYKIALHTQAVVANSVAINEFGMY